MEPRVEKRKGERRKTRDRRTGRDRRSDAERRSGRRATISAGVMAFLEKDSIDGQAINLSDKGLRFDTESPIKVGVRMEAGGEETERWAQLVWAERNDDGSMSYGVEFID